MDKIYYTSIVEHEKLNVHKIRQNNLAKILLNGII